MTRDSGVIAHGYHPIFGTVATIHDGERIGLVLSVPPSFGIDPPGRHSSPMIEGGTEFARLATIASVFVIPIVQIEKDP